MNALAAILTPEFHGSNWTDQEIGWALGRNLLVLSVRIGSDPYGFFGENQGIPGVNVAPQVIASEIVHTLLRNPQTHGEMKRSIVRSFKSASSWDEAKTLKALIMTIEDFTDEEKESLRKACEDNSQVKSAFGVSEAVLRRFA
jgi:hypothetical protein